MSPAARVAAGRRPDIEQELRENYQVEFDFRRGVDTADFDVDKSLHNQARFVSLDEETVEKYKEGVERGDEFPAVLAYRPGRAQSAKLVIIDGNHRLVAHLRAKKKIAVYEIARNTAGKQIAIMTHSFNAKHGRPTSEEENVQAALYLIDNGASQEQAAAVTSAPMRAIKKAVAKKKANERAEEVGVDQREWDALTPSVRSRLLNISTDEGFHGAVHLTYIAGLDANEVFDLVSLLNGSKSAAKQRQVITAETARHQERIQQRAGGGARNNTNRSPAGPKGRLNMALGQLTALPDNISQVAKSYAEAERHDAAVRILDRAEWMRKLAFELDASLA